MLVFHVVFKCKPDMRETFLEKLEAEGIVAACRGEAGNISYRYYIPVDNDCELLLIEKWADMESLKKHAMQTHMVRMDELKAEYVADMTLEYLTAPQDQKNK
jgi:quinol monooxygenase YgiN